MSKKLFIFFVVFTFFSSYHFTHAGLIINEVMYDLSGADSVSGKSKEWIEIYNPDASDISIDASEWRIYDGSANRTINGEIDFSIPTQSYIIFAGDKDTFLADNPGFGGVVYDTGITSLNNTGATLKILDQNGVTVDLITYASSQGGAGDGNSLQKISGSWTGNTPTPGATNEASTPNSSSGGGVGSATQSNNSNDTTIKEVKNKPVEESKIRTKIIVKNIVLVGNPLVFQLTATGYNKEKLFHGGYFINFGDGDSREIQVSSTQNNASMSHTYFYSGEYVMNLEYYMNSYGGVPDASDQMTIRVAPSDISISGVGNEQDFFVELSNNTEYNADISGWILASNLKSFTFPKNTIINPKKKLFISPNLTNFTILDKDTLKLMNSQWKTVFDYGGSINYVIKKENPPIKTTTSVRATPIQEVSADTEEILRLPLVPAENLGALVSSSGVVKNSVIPYAPMLAFVFIGASAGAVYFVRRKGIPFKIGDDFKILDE